MLIWYTTWEPPVTTLLTPRMANGSYHEEE